MVKANIHPRSEAVKNPKLILKERSQIGDTQQIVKLFYDTVPLEDAIAKYRGVEPHSTLVKMACGLGICLGD